MKHTGILLSILQYYPNIQSHINITHFLEGIGVRTYVSWKFCAHLSE